jgi:hypothetical protein
MTTTVIVAADLHTNSKVALCPPATELDDGGTYRLSRSQRWLWDCWQDFLQKVEAIKKDKILILNGDIADADIKDAHSRSTAVSCAIRRTPSGHRPACATKQSALYFAKGRRGQVGKAEILKKLIAEDLGAVRTKRRQLELVICSCKLLTAYH